MSPLQQSDEADHDALRKIRSTYEDALNNRDLEKIKPLLADGFSGVVLSGDEVRTFEDIQAFMNKVWEMTGEGGRHHVNVVADHTDLFGDLAVGRGHNEESFHTPDGKDYAFQAPWTVVARRQNGEWKIFRVHTGLNPMDNVIVTEIVRRTKVFYGLTALGLGLALGVAIRSLWRK
jgi:ketosteroid isomerase-like protein